MFVFGYQAFGVLGIGEIEDSNDILNYSNPKEVKITFEEGENVILAEAPTFVICEITYSEPGIKGDTATNTLKPATIETGATVMVPMFCNEGDLIKVDTRTASYVERVKK